MTEQERIQEQQEKINWAIENLKALRPTDRDRLRFSDAILNGDYKSKPPQVGQSYYDVNVAAVRKFKDELTKVLGLDLLPFGPALVTHIYRDYHSEGYLAVFAQAEDVADAIFSGRR